MERVGAISCLIANALVRPNYLPDHPIIEQFSLVITLREPCADQSKSRTCLLLLQVA